MLRTLTTFTHTLRDEIRRRAVERQLLEVVARLPDQPESRSDYQRLLDEHLALCHDGAGREDPPPSGRR
jgi:hypothetical protein